MIRYPSVAGMFYPKERDILQTDMDNLIKEDDVKISAIGLISPHAGYIYSGKCAGVGFGKIEIPDSIIILGVNHNGRGHPMAVDGNGSWNTPLGDVRIDEELRENLVNRSKVFKIDSIPSEDEHSVEVQLPFIQFLNSSAKILPVTIGARDREILKKGGEEIGNMIREINGKVLMVASTDMSHYVRSDVAKELDTLAIEKIKVLDSDGLFDTVRSNNISMCGVAPTYVMLTAAKVIGASKGEVVEYTNSGYTSGDFDQVVGYLSAYVN